MLNFVQKVVSESAYISRKADFDIKKNSLRNRIANSIFSFADYLNILVSFSMRRLAYFVGDYYFRRKKEMMIEEKQHYLSDSTQIKKDLLDLLGKINANKISKDEIFQFIADKTCEWAGFSACGIYRYDPSKQKLILQSAGWHPQKFNKKSLENTVTIGTAVGMTNYKKVANDYFFKKKEQLGREGVIGRCIFEGLSYYVDNQNEMPLDIPLARMEIELISLFNPKSTAGVPIGFDETLGYAKGVTVVSNDDTYPGLLRARGKLLESFSSFADAVLENKSNVVITEKILDLLVELNNMINFEIEREKQAKKETEKLVAIYGGHLATKSLKNGKENSDMDLSKGFNAETVALFADIKDFTPKTAKLTAKYGPSAVFDFLNSFFGYVCPPITSFAGMIDKFVGDQVFVTMPKEVEPELLPYIQERKELKHAEMIGMASLMSKAMYYGYDKMDSDHKHPLSERLLSIGEWLNFRIGISSGSAIFGDIGFKDEMGRNTRFDLTAVGETINRGARNESNVPINNIMYDHFSHDLLENLVISENDTPVLWQILINDPVMKNSYGEIIQSRKKIKYFDLVLESFKTYYGKAESLYANAEKNDIVIPVKVDLKGIGLVTSYIELWDRKKPLRTLDRFNYLLSMRSDRHDLFIKGLELLVQSIEYDRISKNILQRYLDQEVLKGNINGTHKVDLQKDFYESIMELRKEKSLSDESFNLRKKEIHLSLISRFENLSVQTDPIEFLKSK